MLVAHTKRPSVCSSPLRAIFFEAKRSWSWAWSFASLFWARLMVSISKLSCHPHQRMLFPKWTLRHDIGARMAWRKIVRRVSCSGADGRCSSASRSST